MKPFYVIWDLVKKTKIQTYILLFPLAEVYFEGGHGELLAHSSLVVNRFRDQGWILWTVPVPTTQQPHHMPIFTEPKNKNYDVQP